MTAYGPPSNPNQPPPPGGYGGPPAASGGAKVSPSAVNPLDWAIPGAALLALVFSFFAFYTYDASGVVKQACKTSAADAPAVLKPLCSGDSASAWHGFFGWFGVVLLVLAALAVLAAVFSPQTALPVPIRLIGAGLGALGTLSVLLALFVIPDWPPVADLITDENQYNKSVDGGVGFSWYIVLVLGLVVTVVSFLRFQQTGGALPSRGGSGGTPGQPAYGPPAGGGYGPPQQYGQQSPPQGQPQNPPQGPPQGPPPGYQQGPPQGYQPPPPPQGYQQQPPPPGYSTPPQ